MKVYILLTVLLNCFLLTQIAYAESTTDPNKAEQEDTSEHNAIRSIFLNRFYDSDKSYTEREKAIFQSLENKDNGVLIPKKDIPELYGVLEPIFDNLSKALNKRLETHKVVFSELHIIDSPFPEAFVIAEAQKGQSTLNNHVFVSTGYMRKAIGHLNKMKSYSKTDYDNKIKFLIKNLTGVIAHELAHSIDEGDSYRISLEDFDSQAIEIRADIEGSLLAEDAGYEVESVYTSLNSILALKRKGDKVNHLAFNSTHPQDDLRKTSLRLFLTQYVYRMGLETNKKSKKSSDIINSEKLIDIIYNTHKYTKHLFYNRFLFTPPQSIAEAMNRLSKIDVGSIGIKKRNINLLINYINLRILKEKKPDGLEPYQIIKELLEIGVFIRSGKRLDRSKRGKVYDLALRKSTLESSFMPITSPRNYSLLEKSQNYFLDAIPLYSSSKYLEMINDYFSQLVSKEANKNNGDDTMKNAYKKTFLDYGIKLVPSHLVDSVFSKVFSKTVLNSGESILEVIGFNPDANLLLTKAITEKYNVFSENYIYKLLNLVRSSMVDDVSFSDYKLTLKKWELLSSQGNKEAMENLKSHHNLWINLWENRGKVAYAEFLKGTPLDWHKVAETANSINSGLQFDKIPESNSMISSSVRSAFFKFFSSQEFTNYTDNKNITKKSLQDARIGLPISNNEGYLDYTSFSWNTEGIHRFIHKDISKNIREPNARDVLFILRSSNLYPTESELLYQHEFKKQLKLINHKKTINYKLISEIHKKVMKSVFGLNRMPKYNLQKNDTEEKQEVLLQLINKNYYYMQALAIDSSDTISIEQKSEWIRILFFQDNRPTVGLNTRNWWKLPSNPSFKSTEYIYSLLKKYGFVSDTLDFFEKIMGDGNMIIPKEYVKKKQMTGPKYNDYIEINLLVAKPNEMALKFNALSSEMIADLDKVASGPKNTPVFSRLLSYANVLYLISRNDRYEPTFFDKNRKKSLKTSRTIEVKKKIFTIASLPSNSNIPISKKYTLWLKLTRSGATYASDNYFTSQLLPHISNDLKKVEKLLVGGAIADLKLQLKLAKQVINSDLSKINPGNMTVRSLYLILQKLDSLVSSGSADMDAFIEEIGWKYDVRGLPLNALIEESKSQNWKRASSSLISHGSQLTEYASHLNTESRILILKYIRSPEDRRHLLQEIKKEVSPVFYQIVKENLMKERGAKVYNSIVGPYNNNGGYDTSVITNNEKLNTESNIRLKEASEISVESFLEFLEFFTIKSNNFEKIPFIEILLTAGPYAINTNYNYVDDLALDPMILDYESDSINHKGIKAFLSTIPEHERSTSLAYIISLTGENKDDVAELFKVFQTVGIKFGQMASVWKVFNDIVNEQLKDLKNNAGAMSKHEIEKVLIDSYGAMANDIKLIKVIGSASVKTVVLAEMPNKGLKVIAVKDPNIKRQIDNNLDRSNRFINALNSLGAVNKSALFDVIRNGMQETIYDEIDFLLEAKKTDTYTQALKKVSSNMQLNGWSLKGLSIDKKLSNNNLLVMNFADGVSFDKLHKDMQLEVGPLIVESQLRLLFKHGIFQPDMHKGNVLINIEKQDINFIDLGQVEQFEKVKSLWKKDDVWNVSEFMISFNSRNINKLIDATLQMTKNSNTIFDIKKLSRETASLFSNSNLSEEDLLIRYVEVLAVNDIVLDAKYSFGILKGLITLVGEEYVSREQFTKMMTKEVKSYAIKEKPLKLLSLALTKNSAVSTCSARLSGL